MGFARCLNCATFSDKVASWACCASRTGASAASEGYDDVASELITKAGAEEDAEVLTV